MTPRAWREALLFNGAFAGLALALLGLRLLNPGLLHALLEEDGPVEWATFTTFGLAGFRYFVAARRSSARWPMVVALALGLFSVFVAGEEISWGQRLVGFRPPEVFLEHNFQQETNVHNFLKNILDTRFIVASLSLAYAALRIPRLAPYLPLGWASPAPIALPLLVVAALELHYPFKLVGEAAELLFGVALLFDATARAQGDTPWPALSWPVARATGLACSMGLLLFPINDRVVTHHAQALLPEAQAGAAALSAGLRAAPPWRPRLFKKKRLHKRLYTAARAGFLSGDGGYYLDAWNQPWWMAFTRTGPGAGKVLVYSFGPNRRRDSKIDGIRGAERAEDVLEGDDLGFLLLVPSSTTSLAPR